MTCQNSSTIHKKSITSPFSKDSHTHGEENLERKKNLHWARWIVPSEPLVTERPERLALHELVIDNAVLKKKEPTLMITKIRMISFAQLTATYTIWPGDEGVRLGDCNFSVDAAALGTRVGA